MNPFLPLYQTCNQGPPEAKLVNLADLPIIVDLEPVGACNFRCVMCPTGLGMLGRPSGFMDKDTHAAILGKFPQAALRYIGWGEPTLHPLLPFFIDRAKVDRRITHINTNGSLIDATLAGSLVDSGLDSIKFSFQGADRESYLKMRKTDFFDGMLEAIALMKSVRKDGKPWISASTTTTTESPEVIQSFIERMSGLVDHLSIGRTTFAFIDRERIPKSRVEGFDKARVEDKIRHPIPCPEVFDKLTVHWDGAVRVCCNDYSGITNLGNVNTNTPGEIWRHPTMMEYRERLSRKEYEGPLCKTCDSYIS